MAATSNHVARQTTAKAEPYEGFVKWALVLALTGGCTLGAVFLIDMAWNGSLAAATKSLIEAHGHWQLFGWVGLFIMGVASHILPRFKNTPLRGRSGLSSALVLQLLGIGLRFLAQPLNGTTPFAGGLLVTSGVLEVTAILLFTSVMLATLKASKVPAEPFDRFLKSGLVWFGVAAVMNLGFMAWMAATGSKTVPAGLNEAFLRVQIVGFITMTILGVNVRTLPVFMGLKPLLEGLVPFSFWAVNMGVAIRLASDLALSAGTVGASAARGGHAVEGLLVALGVSVFVYALNVFRKPEFDLGVMGMDTSCEKLVRAALFWLLVAVWAAAGFALFEAATGKIVAHALVGAYRHAITVGFITMMIIGYSVRIFPIFTGQDLVYKWATNTVFYLAFIGNTLRVLFQPLAVFTGKPVFFAIMGVSGTIEVTGLAIFAVTLWKTMAAARRNATVGVQVGQGMPG